MIPSFERCDFKDVVNDWFNQEGVQASTQFLKNEPSLLGSRIETYDDLVINLKEPVRRELERKMDYLPRNDKEINFQLLANAFAKPDLSDPIWKHKDFPLYALLALKEGKIDGMEFSTSQLFYNVLNHPNNKNEIQQIPLFVDHSQNAQAWRLIEETAQPFISQDEKELKILRNDSDLMKKLGLGKPFMTSWQQQNFFDLMSCLTPLQKMFLLIPEPNPISLPRRLKLRNHIGTVTERINAKTPNFNVFCRVSDREFGTSKRMIPSKGMMQAYLSAIGENCALVSQFDLSSFDYLWRGILANERGMGLNFAFLEKIYSADLLLCLDQANELEYHDFYHIDIMNLIRKDRKKFAGLAEITQKISMDNKELEKVGRSFYESLVDMEHVFYRAYYSQNPSNGPPQLIDINLFWSSVNLIIAVLLENYPENKKSFMDFFNKMIEELSCKVDYYNNEYGLNLELILNSNLTNSVHLQKSLGSNYIKELSAHANQWLENQVRGSSALELFDLSKDENSYLIRNRSTRALLKKMTIEKVLDFLNEAKGKKAWAAHVAGLDFVVKNFQALLNHAAMSDETKEALCQELRSRPIHFEYLIKTAVSTNDKQAFDFLMGGDKAFIEKQINHQFSDGCTLLQTARFSRHQGMIDRLLELGAQAIASPPLSDSKESQAPMSFNLIRALINAKALHYSAPFLKP